MTAPVIYRPIREDELTETTQVFVDTVGDLADRNGLPRPPFTVENRLPYYRYVFNTGTFWVGEAESKIVTIANAICRDGVWFLAGFWTLPAHQGKGIGRPLLRRIWNDARASGARVGFTWSSIDFNAITSYMGLGFYPICQIFTFLGKPRAHPKSSANLRVAPLDLELTRQMDRQVRGCERMGDQEFLSSLPGVARQVFRNSQPIGYFHVQGGVIGPAAWTDESAAQELLSLALDEALMQVEEVRLMIPGLNREALRFCNERGLKLVSVAHLMATETFGRMDAYLPSGPLLF